MEREMRITVKLFLCCFFLIAGGLQCIAADETGFPRRVILDRETVVTAGHAVTADAYPNASDIVLDEHVLTRYESDGSSLTWDDEYIKILTEKGKREHQKLTMNFNIHYSDVKPFLVEIIKPDGEVRTVDIEKQGRVMVNRSQMGANIYNPDSKVLQITLPGLEVGDICHYRTFRRNFKAYMPNTWSDYNVWEHTSPIKRILYEIDAPDELPIRKKVLKDQIPGTLKYDIKKTDGRILHRWKLSDVPRMYEEPDMPALYTVTQRMLLSTIPDWETVSRWYWNLCKPRLDTVTPEMRTKVAELIDGAESDMEKVRKIFRFVSQEVRYMGITTEDTAPGYEPHDVSITFKNRYGVCRDKAALLASMLQLAGLKGYPVLIHVGPKKDIEVPQPYFNHAICAVELKQGKYTLMDPTDESTRDLLPGYLCDKSYLVAKPEGETLLTSPIVPARKNLMRISSSGGVNAARVLSMETHMIFEGVNDSIYRGVFAKQKPDDRRRFFETRIKNTIPGAVLTSFEIKPVNLLNTEVPLTVSLSFTAEDYPLRGEHLVMLPPPWLGKSIGMVNYILRGTGLDKRKYPLVTKMTCGIDETFTIDLSNASFTTATTPKTVSLDTGKTLFSQEYSVNGKQLTGHETFLLKAVEFLPAEYLEMKSLLADREVAQRRNPICVSTAQDAKKPNAVVLSKQTDVTLTDIGTWKTTTTVKKKILSYGGKKENSELKINYNPIWESVEIESAKVTNNDDAVRVLSDEEVNLMDAAWVAAGPRYPAGKTLVISLPGVEIGSIIETRITRTSFGKPFFDMNWSPAEHNPVETATLTINTPVEIPLHIMTTSNKMVSGQSPEMNSEAKNGRIVRTWRARNLPSVKDEMNLPPWWTFKPTVFISAGNWKDYTSKIREKLAVATRKQEKSAALAKNITAGAISKIEKITAIRDYVAKNITVAGPSLPALPLSSFTSADQTLAEGYGNTTDRAITLFALMKKVHLKPELILASSWGPRTTVALEPLTEYPARSLFDSLLVRVKTKGGYVYLNDSDQYAALGTTAFDGRPGLTLDGQHITIKAQPDREDRDVSEYTIEIDESGNVKLKYAQKYFGTEYGAFLRTFAEMPPEERRRYHQEILTSISQLAKADGELTTDYTSYPGIKSFSAKIEHYAIREGKHLYFTIPHLLDSILPVDTDTRENPLSIPASLRAEACFTLILPEKTKNIQLLPPDIDWTGPAGMGSIFFKSKLQTMKSGRKMIVIHRTVNFSPAVIDASEYGELSRINRKTTHPATRTIMLEIE